MPSEPSVLAEQIDWYLRCLRARPSSPSTVRVYRAALRRMADFCAERGCTCAETLTLDLVRDAAIAMLDEGAALLKRGAGNTKGNEGIARMLVTATRGLCVQLRRDRGILAPDLSTLRAPRQPQRIQPRVDYDAFDRLETTTTSMRSDPFLLARDRALLQFLFETGLRSIEFSRLNLSDLDLERGLVTVHLGKGRKPRVLCILDPDEQAHDGGETLKRLRTYLAARRARVGDRCRALWVGVRGHRMSPNTLRSTLHDLASGAGIENKPPHAFRRGWFTLAYRSEPRDLPVLAARMGWSEHTQGMVSVYTRGAVLDFAAQPRPLVTRGRVR